MTEVLKQIAEAIGQNKIDITEESRLNYGRDWTRAHSVNAAAVIFPESTVDVSKILKICSETKTSVIPSGGRTGLAAGAVATQGEIVLSLERMRKMGEVDPIAQSIWVQAGAVTEAVHQRCAKEGLTWPVDFASKGSSQVGGNISTNAGGVRVIRYGLTRNWVLGLTVVLMSGKVLQLNGALEKNNTGFDLRQAFIGTEGTLGVITEAVLKLCPLPGESDVLFFGLKDLDAVFELFLKARKSGFTLNAFECLSRDCLEAVLELRGFREPLEVKSAQYVLMEIEKSESTKDKVEAWIAKLFEGEIVEGGTLAQSSKEVTALWAMREGITEALVARGRVHKHDIALPISQVKAFLKDWTSTLGEQYKGLEPYIFGHIGDGNLHINVIKPAAMSDADFVSKTKAMDREMFEILQKYQGSVSAEHGIGLLKRDLMKYSKSTEELSLLRDLKRVFDPQGLLNPGKILESSDPIA